jgi:hypothetical protein
MSEIHEIGGVRHQIYQRIIFCGQLAGINLDSCTPDKLLSCSYKNYLLYRSYKKCTQLSCRHLRYAK